jgi:hypothetical protein
MDRCGNFVGVQTFAIDLAPEAAYPCETLFDGHRPGLEGNFQAIDYFTADGAVMRTGSDRQSFMQVIRDIFYCD